LNWLEVSITLTGELVEPVADVFQRVASSGVAFTPLHSEDTQISSASPITLRAYIPVDAQTNTKRRQIQRHLSHLNMITAIPKPEFKIIEEQDWAEAWKARYRPLPVGQRLQIVPSWLAAEARGRLVIRLDPGMAFGTGTHPSTQLCLEALEKQVHRGMLVADLGCGSGILSIAAALLGARQVLAIDSDPKAVHTASDNVDRNGVASQVEVSHGSLPELLAALDERGQRADITVANILARVLVEMLHQSLRQTLSGEGLLILSGVLDDQLDEVLQAAQGEGLLPVGTPRMGDWRAVLLKNGPPQ
jgi:ribosomal protein L11 methyltransferase